MKMGGSGKECVFFLLVTGWLVGHLVGNATGETGVELRSDHAEFEESVRHPSEK